MATCENTTPARPNRNSLPKLVLPNRNADAEGDGFYVQVGNSFQRAPDARVIEYAQQRIAAQFCSGEKVINPSQVADFLMLQIGGRDHEVFAVMLLDKARRFIGYEELFQGTVDTAYVHVRRVLSCVIQSRASGVVIAHNHPGGDCEPSHADVRITYQLYRTLPMLEVELLDHMIVGKSVLSFASRGWLQAPWLSLHAGA